MTFDFAGNDFAGSDFAGSDFAGSDFASRDFIPERTTILFSMFLSLFPLIIKCYAGFSYPTHLQTKLLIVGTFGSRVF